MRLWKFENQHGPATGHRVRNEVLQMVWGGARVKQAIPDKGQEFLKVCFGNDHRSGYSCVEACQDRSHRSQWTAQIGVQILTCRSVIGCQIHYVQMIANSVV